MHLLAVNDTDFLRPTADSLRKAGEVLLLIEYSRSAGSKSFEFIRSVTELTERLAQLPVGTRVTAFINTQLPLRGNVDDQFIDDCLRQIRDGSEFLVVETAPRSVASVTWFHHEAGTSREELRNALEDLRGQTVAAGGYPKAHAENNSAITAYVPDSTGRIQIGAY